MSVAAFLPSEAKASTWPLCLSVSSASLFNFILGLKAFYSFYLTLVYLFPCDAQVPWITVLLHGRLPFSRWCSAKQKPLIGPGEFLQYVNTFKNSWYEKQSHTSPVLRFINFRKRWGIVTASRLQSCPVFSSTSTRGQRARKFNSAVARVYNHALVPTHRRFLRNSSLIGTRMTREPLLLNDFKQSWCMFFFKGCFISLCNVLLWKDSSVAEMKPSREVFQHLQDLV